MLRFGENWSERQDSNLRPLVPQTSALPGCATLRLEAPHVASLITNAKLKALHPRFWP